MQKVGFEKAELVGETGFNSTPKTKGVLLRAEKPANVILRQESVLLGSAIGVGPS